MELVRETCEREAELQSSSLEVRLVWLVVAAGSGPFLGLLGTVWGIMDAFFRIGNQASAGLNVVAPGIAEALMTTGVGLLVALPAAAAHQILSRLDQRERPPRDRRHLRAAAALANDDGAGARSPAERSPRVGTSTRRRR